MNFAFSEEQEQLREFVRSFLEDKSAEDAVREQMDTEQGYDEAVWNQMAEQMGEASAEQEKQLTEEEIAERKKRRKLTRVRAGRKIQAKRMEAAFDALWNARVAMIGFAGLFVNHFMPGAVPGLGGFH